MSTLSVHNLQGISTFSNKIEVPSGHKLSCAGGQYRLPNYSGNSKPSNPELGELILNTTTATLEVWTGDRWAVCGGGNRGGSQSNPATSGGDAYDNGQQTSGTVWVTIPGSGAFEFTYDATDRYGSGDNGWIKYDASFFGANNSAIAHVEYGSPSTIIPAWNTNSTSSTSNDTISQGKLRIGREQSHAGGNSLSTIRCSLPRFTKAKYQASMQAGGADAADFGSFTQNFSGIVNNSPYQNNGQGYWAVLFSGNQSGNFGSDMLILDPGNLRSGNGSYSNNTSVLSFGTERGSTSQVPQIIWGTTDAYREYVYVNSWELWLH
tara:strand:- start:937 stop:1899 length:963 start_codon:yes stop_codon:yes gene_type:complete